MAYFSNGEEGRYYEAKYCDKCVNQDPEIGCQIWGLHFLYNYQREKYGEFLDMLIPMKNGYADRCTMFLPGEHPTVAIQTRSALAEKELQKLEAWRKAVQA